MNMDAQIDIAILYVEDDAAAQDEVRDLLRDRVREIHVAKNGAEGLEQFRRHAPDLVVTDIRMPIMDGLQMAKAIRAIDSAVPIIVTTAHSDTVFLLDAIDIGIDYYVVKPIASKKLMAAVEKCVTIIENEGAAKRYNEERERLIGELQKALAEIKTLHGILPICSHCKKIRDDKGSWTQMEAYISEHTDAEFSHGLCADCAKKHYPEHFQ